ncbi:hypothetical protein ST201phi2-1p184 [Pseudomonas phage 201phi2-1]|uniref:Uncharacterized protein n=1 Tax=Pseudomonas phage 201phi2-1 TaxID=198110 RepID=B3FJ47_BP201|nr:hypothetical protein ST201phi2-1p184 [Pseudomonas phage 201phi2-1]ABY63014.1 hypothetical protein 201phi2-1p184 [Pseudomonas phage 201phi2-1]
MDMQKLFEMISRVADTSNALLIPDRSVIVSWIKATEEPEMFFGIPQLWDIIDTLRESTYSTVSEKRSMTKEALRLIVQELIERRGLDLMYRFPNVGASLHVGVVVRDTHTGSEAIYGIRDVNPDGEPTWEYLPIDHSRFFDVIQWRMNHACRQSIYGWHDPIHINKPLEF